MTEAEKIAQLDKLINEFCDSTIAVIESFQSKAHTIVSMPTTPPPTQLTESKQGTTHIIGGLPLIDAALTTWTINPDGRVVHGNLVDTATARVIRLRYWDHEVYQENMDHNWWVWRMAWVQVAGDPATPVTVPPQPIGPGLPLPTGALHTNGSQIVGMDGNNVRIACVGVQQLQDHIPTDMPLIKSLGFNAIRVSWTNETRMEQLLVFDKIIAAAEIHQIGVILCNHTNNRGHSPADNWGAQQRNGLWYDMGGASDGTDGGGNVGSTDHARFVRDWQTIAIRYRNAASVIGYDIRNEPLSYPGMCTWGDGDRDHDIRMMYEEVGNAIHVIDPRQLIICEGPQNYNVQCPWGDLSRAKQHPVRLSIPNKVVYSVHNYPLYVSGFRPNSGPEYVTLCNKFWGYLVKENIAPVFIGEMGGNFSGAPENEGDEVVSETTEWARTLLAYMNGNAADGPRITAGQQGISGCWWHWGDLGNQQLTGVLKGRLPKPEQQTWWKQILYTR